MRLFSIKFVEKVMNVIQVTLDEDADVGFLQKMIENIKGVVGTSHIKTGRTASSSDIDDWIKNIHSIQADIDPSLIDMDDERTRYIMSK